MARLQELVDTEDILVNENARTRRNINAMIEQIPSMDSSITDAKLEAEKLRITSQITRMKMIQLLSEVANLLQKRQ